MLWAFDMEVTTDPATGKPFVIDSSVETGYREGLALFPPEFPVTLTLRSEAKRKVIEESYHAACRDVFAKYDAIETVLTS